MVTQIANVWEEAKVISVKRGNRLYPVAELEPGVKFFVLMLEKLGGCPLFSCEGHPYGFYIVCKNLPSHVVSEIALLGEFVVETCALLDGSLATRLSLEHNELSCLRAGVEWTEAFKEEVLINLARQWCEEFGPIEKKDDSVAKTFSVELPYLENKTVNISVDEIVDLDLHARTRLGISEDTRMSSIEIINQANFEEVFVLDDWEVDLVNWPFRRKTTKAENSDSIDDPALMFTHEELLDWLENWEAQQK